MLGSYNYIGNANQDVHSGILSLTDARYNIPEAIPDIGVVTSGACTGLSTGVELDYSDWTVAKGQEVYVFTSHDGTQFDGDGPEGWDIVYQTGNTVEGWVFRRFLDGTESGTVVFAPDSNTQKTTGSYLVMEGSSLLEFGVPEIGTSSPVCPEVTGLTSGDFAVAIGWQDDDILSSFTPTGSGPSWTTVTVGSAHTESSNLASRVFVAYRELSSTTSEQVTLTTSLGDRVAGVQMILTQRT